MADTITTGIKNTWEDIKKDVKNTSTNNPLKKLKNEVVAGVNKTKNNIESDTEEDVI